MLSLAIREKGVVVETSVLVQSDECIERIVPKRKPDLWLTDGKGWIIAPEKRRVFGTHVNKQIEEQNKASKMMFNDDELTSFFTLVGVGSRWADNLDVDWCLCLGDEELRTGMKI